MGIATKTRRGVNDGITPQKKSACDHRTAYEHLEVDAEGNLICK